MKQFVDQPPWVNAKPLDWMAPVATADWSAAREAGRLLEFLGATVTVHQSPSPALVSGPAVVDGAPSSVAEDWAASGVRDLTGRIDGPPLDPIGRPATIARAAMLALELITTSLGETVRIDGAPLLGQRIQLGDWIRRGDISVGGAARLLRAADGWWALNLPRETDLELVPALVEHSISGDPWRAVADWSREWPTTDVVDRAILLGLAAGQLQRPHSGNAPWKIATRKTFNLRGVRETPRVVNLGALWAGPLCAHLLHHFGAQVIDVESEHRPDGVREGNPDFYRTLHEGHELVMFDFFSAAGRNDLIDLIRSADVVIEASRPRALRRLGIGVSDIVADGLPRVWVQITGHGLKSPNRIGFGDDTAVDGGLVAFDDEGPVFVGDAIADPLTGSLAALAVVACIGKPATSMVEMSLREVSAYCASAKGI